MIERPNLPISFHMSFQPERHYMSALLQFVKTNGNTSVEEISAETGIPTGVHTGKVKPLLQYASGMGLMELISPVGAGRISPRLLPLGQAILRDDPFLLEESTQWALHLMLCRNFGGAEVWNAVFVEAARVFGRNLSNGQFDDFLANRYGAKRDVVGPLFQTYSDMAALGKVAAISQNDFQIAFRKAPMQQAMIDSVGALLFLEWDALFPGQAQVALRDIETLTGLITATGWELGEQSQFFAEMEGVGLVKIDRQTGAPILTRLKATENVLQVMYDRLV